MPFPFRTCLKVLVALPALAAPLAPLHAQGNDPFATKPPVLRGAPTPPPQFRSIGWNALTPPGWNAMKGFEGTDLRSLEDGDPRATEMLKKMRAAWDKAPVNMAMVGQPVRIAGYVVPLEESAAGLTEFLLVPYYGACVHSPPPPANQILHVVPRAPVKFKTMDTVWVSGALAYQRTDSTMGTSSWRIGAVEVRAYEGGGLTQPLR